MKLPGALAGSALLLSHPRSSASERAPSIIRGPYHLSSLAGDDSSRCGPKCVPSVLMNPKGTLWGWADARSGPLSVAVCSGASMWNGAKPASARFLSRQLLTSRWAAGSPLPSHRPSEVPQLPSSLALPPALPAKGQRLGWGHQGLEWGDRKVKREHPSLLSSP